MSSDRRALWTRGSLLVDFREPNNGGGGGGGGSSRGGGDGGCEFLYNSRARQQLMAAPLAAAAGL